MSIHEQQPQQRDTQTCHNLHLVGACILHKSVPLLLWNYTKLQPSFSNAAIPKKTNHPVFLIFLFFKFWPRIQDRSCSSRQFRCSQAAAVGHRPQFRWPLSSRQDQHRRDPAPAAGPADAYAEPQLHSSGSAAGTRGQREDPCMWRLQQNHKVRRRSHSCSDSLIHFSRVKSSQCLCLFQSAVRRSDTSFRTFNTHDDRLNVCSQHN